MRLAHIGVNRLAAYTAVSLALALLIWPAFGHAIEVWSTDEEFTYGFLIPPIALALLWLRRGALRRAVGDGQNGGLAVVAAAISLMLVSQRTGIHNLAGIAVTPLLIGVAAYLWGWRAARAIAFPSAFLIFGLGLYRGLLNSVGFALQDVTAFGAAWAGRLIGLDVMRDGLVLHSTSATPEYAFVVAEACSGMSSLLSLLALAAIWVYATRGPLVGRAAVFAGVLPLVVIANTARVTLVVLVAAHFGEDAALGFFHGVSSLLLFGLALGGLLVLSRTVGCRLPSFAPSF
ncbi:MAG: exosortase/archaeosortase family protein [Chloroflexi bacterium]|nr:exosortase/archaeosortase family protein [Chloroflexota bacterium]